MSRHVPFVLLGVILAVIFLDAAIPIQLKSFLYSLSLTTKSLIVFLLPCVVFMLLFKVVSQFAGKATKLLVLIFAAVICSNFFSTMVSYHVGSLVYQLDLSMVSPKVLEGQLLPLWTLQIPQWIGNGTALFSGMILGVLCSFFSPKLSRNISSRFEVWIRYLLRLFVSLIPVFLIGFLIKLVHDKVIQQMIRDYALIFGVVALAQFGYIFLLYFITNRFKVKEFCTSVKNMFPAAVAALSSMSSAAAMPMLIACTQKNTKDSDFPLISIPATVNIHLIGDCFAIPVFAFAVMKNFGAPEPLFTSYLIFAVYFVMAKFSVAAIPGGGILVMLPFLESCLGFNTEMASMITALYILFDPVITCANVLGNGAFSMGLHRIWSRGALSWRRK